MSKLKLIPKHQIGGTYLPKYEYEWVVTPKDVAVEKHQRVPENLWENYWANQGANSVNNAMNNAGKNILDGLMTASYFTPMGNVTYGASIAADMLNGNTKDALLKAAIGIIPVGKIGMLKNVTPKIITSSTRPKLTGNEILREKIASIQGRNFKILENPENGALYSIQRVLKEFPKTQIKDLSGIKTYTLGKETPYLGKIRTPEEIEVLRAKLSANGKVAGRASAEARANSTEYAERIAKQKAETAAKNAKIKERKERIRAIKQTERDIKQKYGNRMSSIYRRPNGKGYYNNNALTADDLYDEFNTLKP